MTNKKYHNQMIFARARLFDYVINKLGYKRNGLKLKSAIKIFADNQNLIIEENKNRKEWLLNLYLSGSNEVIKKGAKILSPSLFKSKKFKRERKQNYNDYIKSSKWRTFKSKLIKLRGNFCEKCGKNNIVLHGHHKTYERLFNELPEDILLLCKNCHIKIHN